MWSRLRRLITRMDPRTRVPAKPESDVARDPHQAAARPSGGAADHRAPADNPSPTGPGPSGTFVGRVSGDDLGYVGETGAEAREDRDGEAR